MSHFPHLSRLALLVGLSFLSGCSSILPARGPAPDVFRLSTINLPAREGKPLQAQLVVDVPIAMGGLNTDRVVIHENSYELTYMAGTRWTDQVPRLVQSALVQALESTNAFAGVGRQEEGIRRNFDLVSDLRAFDVNTQGMSHPHIVVTLAAKLLRAPIGEVLASKLFKADVEAKGRGNEEIVGAFDEAMTAVATDIANWAAENAAHRTAEAQPVQPAATPAASPNTASQ